MKTLSAAMRALSTYMQRYGRRLKGQHVVSLKLYARTLKGLLAFCDKVRSDRDAKRPSKSTSSSSSSRSSSFKAASASGPSELIYLPHSVVEGFSEDVNLGSVEAYLRDSHMSQKVGRKFWV